MNPNNMIDKDDSILLTDNRNQKRLIKISDNRKFKWRKIPIELSQLLKYQYGTNFEIENGVFKKIDRIQPIDLQQQILNQEQQQPQQKIDNREIFTENAQTTQKLQYQQIQALKKVTADRKNLIAVIAQNNQQFQKRTAYSKQKYLKRKKAKYMFTFVVQKANIQNVTQYYFQQQPKSTCYFRWDTLALFLHYAGIGKKILLVQKTKGLIAGALLLKGAEDITFVNQQKKHPCRMLVYQNLNIQKQLNKKINSKKIEQILNQQTKFTNFVIAGDVDSQDFLQKLDQKIDIGALITVYSTYLEPLTRTFDFMLNSKRFINVQLFDTFTRRYQVLKNRTHPMMNMFGFGGYILIAIKVEQKS